MDNNIEYSEILKELDEIDAEIEELLSNSWIMTKRDDKCCIFVNGEENRIITTSYINALFK